MSSKITYGTGEYIHIIEDEGYRHLKIFRSSFRNKLLMVAETADGSLLHVHPVDLEYIETMGVPIELIERF